MRFLFFHEIPEYGSWTLRIILGLCAVGALFLCGGLLLDIKLIPYGYGLILSSVIFFYLRAYSIRFLHWLVSATGSSISITRTVDLPIDIVERCQTLGIKAPTFYKFYLKGRGPARIYLRYRNREERALYDLKYR